MKATIVKVSNSWYATGKDLFHRISRKSLEAFEEKLYPQIRVDGQIETEIYAYKKNSGVREIFEITKVHEENKRLTVNQLMILMEVHRGSHMLYPIGTYTDDKERLCAKGLIDFDKEDECEYFTTEKGDKLIECLKMSGENFLVNYE